MKKALAMISKYKIGIGILILAIIGTIGMVKIVNASNADLDLPYYLQVITDGRAEKTGIRKETASSVSGEIYDAIDNGAVINDDQWKNVYNYYRAHQRIVGGKEAVKPYQDEIEKTLSK